MLIQTHLSRLLTILLAATAFLFFAPASVSAKGIDWDKRLEKGRHELAIGNLDKAIDIFSSEVKHHPEAGPPHTDLGRTMKRKGNLAGAKSEFRRATEVDPSYADAYYELGAMEEGEEEWALAAAAFEHYLQLDTGSARRASVAERLRNCKLHL